LRRILVSILLVTNAYAQQNPFVGDTTTQISEHVWGVMGFPNIGIVVGSQATLVVDTGMGPRNGAKVMNFVEKLAPGNTKLFLTTTHFHPEHVAGEQGFPPGTILIRNAVQQQEVDAGGADRVERFRNNSSTSRELLEGVVLRHPDVVFGNEATVDLGGGVIVQLLWFGGAHTKGDELIFVAPDRTLISGDVVQNKAMPNIPDTGSSPSTWLAVLEKVAAMKPVHVLPDHTPPGDGSMVAAERAMILELRTRALELKRRGVSAEDAGKQVSEDLKKAHPDWPNTNAAAFVRSVYLEEK
jgi:glyoxylase-like metal-dependent hydrolase (beta-lactamase superfamily II)